MQIDQKKNGYLKYAAVVKYLCKFIVENLPTLIMFEFLNPLDNKTDDSYFALIDGLKDEIYFYVIGTKTEELIPSKSFRTKDDQEFIDSIPKIIDSRNFKLVIIVIFKYAATDNLQFCYKLREKLQNIPHCFITNEACIHSTILVNANIKSNIDDSILIVCTKENNDVSVADLIYTSKGYMISADRSVTIDPKESNEKNREKLIGSSNPKRIIVSAAKSSNPIVKLIRNNLLKSKKLVTLEHKVLQVYPKYVVEMSKWFNDRGYLRYHIIPRCTKRFAFFSAYSSQPFLFADYGSLLPYNDKMMISRTCLRPLAFIVDQNIDEEFLKKKSSLPAAHGYSLSLKIDEEHFPTYSVTPVMFPGIEKFPQNFDKTVSSKVPVIAFFDNLSIVCFNKNGTYEFLNSWNGILGEEMVISFDEEKLKFGDKAVEAQQNDKLTYTVYDLLKIMSMPTDKISIIDAWMFKITENSENPVLLEFDNFDGSRKAAPPAFLMALILKEIKKRIKKEIGEKPKKLAFWICKDQYKNEEEIERIKDQLVEACSLIRITCEFC